MPQPELWKIFCEPVHILAKDDGFAGQVLRRQENWILQEAERRNDPWQFLLGVRGVSKFDRDVFIAAQSQREAARHATDILARWGTLRTSLRAGLVRALEIEHKPAIDKAATKFFRAILRTQSRDFQRSISSRYLSQHGRTDVRRLIDSETRTLRKQHGQKWADKTSHQIGKSDVTYNKLIVLLVRWWVRVGLNGPPGFMFYSNKALTDLFTVLLNDNRLNEDRIEQTRYRLGLKPASSKRPLIVGVIPDHEKAKILFQGRRWNFRDPGTGKTFSGDTTCESDGSQITFCGVRLFPHKTGRHFKD